MTRRREPICPVFAVEGVVRCVTSSTFPGLSGLRGGFDSVATGRLEFDEGLAILKSHFCIVFKSPQALQETRVWRCLADFGDVVRRFAMVEEIAVTFRCPTDPGLTFCVE